MQDLERYKDKERRKAYQSKYGVKYQKENYRKLTVLVSKNDNAILARLESVSNRSDYIRSLILQDIERNP